MQVLWIICCPRFISIKVTPILRRIDIEDQIDTSRCEHGHANVMAKVRVDGVYPNGLFFVSSDQRRLLANKLHTFMPSSWNNAISRAHMVGFRRGSLEFETAEEPPG